MSLAFLIRNRKSDCGPFWAMRWPYWRSIWIFPTTLTWSFAAILISGGHHCTVVWLLFFTATAIASSTFAFVFSFIQMRSHFNLA